MRRKKIIIISVAACFVLLNIGLILAQEPETETQEQPPTAEQEQVASGPQVQWLWGEVVSADPTNKTLLIKYFDYETDSEKETSIVLDDKTTYENVNSIEEIKPQDTASIDYTVDARGKNIAKNISVEKAESNIEPQEKKAVEEKPEDLSPQTEE